MTRFEQYTSDQLAEWRGEVRTLVAKMEDRKHLLNADDQQKLKNGKALLKALTREIKARFTQPRLF
jgi:hypothetical protein